MKNKKLIIMLIFVVICIVTLFIILPKEKEYSISFNSDGGSNVEQLKVKEGQKIEITKNPTKEGYNFIGWALNGKTFDFSQGIKKDTTLVAVWKKIDDSIETFVITFDTDGGNTIANQIVEKDKKIEKPSDPTKKGYSFNGWYVEGREYLFDIEVNSDLTIKAKWNKEETNKNSNINNSKNVDTSATINTNSNNNNNNISTIENKTNNKEQIIIPAPIITHSLLGHENTKSLYEIAIDYDKYRINGANYLSGWELYVTTDKNAGNELFIDGKGYFYHSDNGNETVRTAETAWGDTYKYIARAYIDTQDGRVYSDWSNTIVITNNIPAPIITYSLLGHENTKNLYEVAIDYDKYTINNDNYLSGWELYVTTEENEGNEIIIDNKGYFYHSDNEKDTVRTVEIPKNKKYTYVARTYINMPDGKIYSNWSNKITIESN